MAENHQVTILLATVAEYRQLQDKKDRMKNWFSGKDQNRLYYLKKLIDKEIKEYPMKASQYQLF